MSSSPDTLSGNDGEREYEITVAPELRGKVTYANVISPQGFFGARLRLHSPGKLFSARTQAYAFAFLTTENSVEMHRNEDVASVSLPPERDAELFIRANWTPTELDVGVVVVGKPARSSFRSRPTSCATRRA